MPGSGVATRVRKRSLRFAAEVIVSVLNWGLGWNLIVHVLCAFRMVALAAQVHATEEGRHCAVLPHYHRRHDFWLRYQLRKDQ